MFSSFGTSQGSRPKDPSSGSSSLSSPSTMPSSYCRRGNTLHWVLPLLTTLHCCDPECQAFFFTTDMSLTFDMMCRNFMALYNLKWPKDMKWCSFCKLNVTSTWSSTPPPLPHVMQGTAPIDSPRNTSEELSIRLPVSFLLEPSREYGKPGDYRTKQLHYSAELFCFWKHFTDGAH